MATISKDELLKIAQLSKLKLTEHEIPVLIQQIQAVLSYAQRVKEVLHLDVSEGAVRKNINVFREDVVAQTNPEPIMKQAPEVEQNYFVVPVIIEQS